MGKETGSFPPEGDLDSNVKNPFILLNIPHSSMGIPDYVRPSLLLSDEELDNELMLMTDSFTDNLFQINDESVTSTIFPISRLVVDPERFASDNDEPMVAKSMGVIYTKTSSGRPLREGITNEERNQLLLAYYHSHHQRSSIVVQNAISSHGYCLIVDCHSFPSKPLPYESDQDPNRLDICIGTDGFHTPDWLADEALKLFRKIGFSIKINSPFSGSFVPQQYYRSYRQVLSIMVEVNRSLYMGEISGHRANDYDSLKKRLQAIMRSLFLCFMEHNKLVPNPST